MASPARAQRVLVIDDDELSRSVLELHLGEAGYIVVSVESGEAAVALLVSSDLPAPDVILSDLQMPGLSASALATRLRSLAGPATRLLVMSGSQPSPERIAGFDHFLLKPFTPAEFTAALATPASAASSPTLIATQATSTPVLDLTAFAQLHAMLKAAQLTELFALAFTELDRHLCLMRRALEEETPAVLRSSAHTIKGSFGMLGARELQTIAAALEAGDLSPADQAASLNEIPRAVARLQGMLTSHGVHLFRDTSSGQETQ